MNIVIEYGISSSHDSLEAWFGGTLKVDGVKFAV